MLFWIFVIMFILGIVVLVVANSAWSYHNDFDDFLNCIGCVFVTVGSIAVIISLLIIGVEHMGSDGDAAGLAEERKAIVYQLENNLYDNDNDIGKRELFTEITEWNAKIARWTANQDNFWIGIYYADIYDQFEPIELEALE